MPPHLSDNVRRQLEEEISSGRLQPGARVDEKEISRRFKVSRTPAREALQQLLSAGLVRMVPRQGAVVTRASLREVIGMLEVLIVLEGEAARLAARRMSTPTRARLVEVHDSMREAVDRSSYEAYVTANATFHELIYVGAKNEYLATEIRQIRSRLNQYRKSALHTPGRLLSSWAEHSAVVDAIQRGDEAQARLAMIDHIAAGGNVFTDLVAEALEDV